MKKVAVLSMLLLIFVSNAAFSQKVVKTSSIDVKLFGLVDYAREFPVSNKTVINVFGGMNSGFSWNSFDGISFAFFPVVGVEPRIYYNMAKRLSKNKKIDFNSANYVALNCTFLFGVFSNNSNMVESAFTVTPEWGFRRYLGKQFTFDLALGPMLYKARADYIKASISALVTFSYQFKIKNTGSVH